MRLFEKDSAIFSECLKIYEQSFPRCERRDEVNLEASLLDPRFNFMAILQDQEVFGVLCFWVFEPQDSSKFIYLENIAMAPKARNRGLGVLVMDYLKSYGTRIVLEIEPPQDEITSRRLGFYTRGGFILNAYSHIQPPYHRDEPSLELRIMSWPDSISTSDYKLFAECQKAIMPCFE